MRSHPRSTLASFALKTLTGAVASAVFVTSAYAAGLGKLTVHSALGQPLNAEIELTSVSSDESSGLVAKLAAPDAFRLANIDFNPALMSLRFAVEQRGGRQFIKITSSQPLNEPFVDMLLELSWNGGRLVREYTFLLDPAEIRTTQSAQVAAATPAQAARGTAAQRSAPAPRAARPATPAPARQESGAPANENANQYKVQRGDTLGKIAREIKPIDISLDMMLVALYRANPDAFAGNNMNRLKSGTILSVPDSQAIKGSTNDGAARGTVIAHATDFNAYRNKLAGQVATAAPDRERADNQSAAGKITAQVKERPTAASEAQDKLRLSKAAASTAGAAMSAEEKIAKDKALAEATARVKELERNVSDLEKLMAIKSKTASEVAKPPVAAPAAAPVAAPAAAPAVPATPAAAPAPTPAPAASVPAPVVQETPAEPEKPAKKAASQPEPAAEPSLADTIMDNITTIALGLGAVLLAALGIAALRRRKAAAAAAPSEPSVLGAPTDQAHSLFAETGGQSVDTNNSVFNSSFAPSASQLDTNEVDPVAEADVYIAYGRDAQAEEILKEALRTHPERMPVRLKLLEIYAARKDLRSFETQATEMYSITRGVGDDWAQAAALGLTIDAANPLYANAAQGAAFQAPSVAEPAQQVVLTKPASNQAHDPLTVTPANTGMDLDLDLSNDATIVPQPHVPVIASAAPVAAAAAAEEDHTLDFDLGGLSFEPVNTTAANSAHAVHDEPAMDFTIPDTVTPVVAPTLAPAPALATTADDESFDMAFDMGFDSPAEELTAAPVAEARPLDEFSLDLGKADAPAQFGSVNLAKEFDLPVLPDSPTGAPASEPLQAQPVDFGSMDFDLTPLPATTAATPLDFSPAGAAAAEQSDDDYFNLDLPASASTDTPAVPASAAPQFDITSIDLDLPAEQASQAGAHSFDNAPTALPDLGFADHGDVGQGAAEAELSAVQMEMETKLDLAIAYQEIGDKEGARELLDEVIKGGSAEQASRANDMRVKLA